MFKNNYSGRFYVNLIITLITSIGFYVKRNYLFSNGNEILLKDIKIAKFSNNRISDYTTVIIITKNKSRRRIKLATENDQDIILKNLFVEHYILVV